MKIIVGVDGSDASKDALRWAVGEAHAHRAELVALHAYELELPVPDATPAPPPDIAGLIAEVHEGAIQSVTEIVDEIAGQDSDVVVSAVEGRPAEVLIEAAAEADLLVLGSHGAGVSELLIGSVTHECVHHAPCPVLVHRRR